MPYRFAHLYVLGLLAVTVVAFWPGYFAVLRTAPWGFHLHGVTASAWMLLLAIQGWSIHARRVDLHRAVGIASLTLFPIFLAGAAAVVLSMAQATPDAPFYRRYGARLGTLDLSAMAVLAWLYYQALAQRRRVQLHARYMLATPLLLLAPILGRLLGHLVPALQIDGPADLYLFAWSTRIANGIAIACAAGLYLQAPRHGYPFLVVGIVLVVQSALFDTLGRAPAWQALFVALGTVPVAPVLLAAAAAGAAVTWAGWTAGRRAPARAAIAA